MRTIERAGRVLAFWLIPLCLLGCNPRTRTVRTAPARRSTSPRLASGAVLHLVPPTVHSVCARSRGLAPLYQELQAALARYGFQLVPGQSLRRELTFSVAVVVHQGDDDCRRYCVPATLVSRLTAAAQHQTRRQTIRWCGGQILSYRAFRVLGYQLAMQVSSSAVGAGREDWRALTGEAAPLPPMPSTPPARAPHAPPATPADIVAVFDLQVDTQTQRTQITAQLRDYLAVQLTATGYRVVPRGRIRRRLIDEKKQTYRDCFDHLCQITLGKALAADKSLSTRLVTLDDGGGCMITSVLYDLKTEVAERAASVRTSCSGVALFSGMDTIARTLRERAGFAHGESGS